MAVSSAPSEGKELKEIIIPDLPNFDAIVEKWPPHQFNDALAYFRAHKHDEDPVSRLTALSEMFLYQSGMAPPNSPFFIVFCEELSVYIHTYLAKAFTSDVVDDLYHNLDILTDELFEMTKRLSQTSAITESNLRLLKAMGLQHARVGAVFALLSKNANNTMRVEDPRCEPLKTKLDDFNEKMIQYCALHQELKSQGKYFCDEFLFLAGIDEWYYDLCFGFDTVPASDSKERIDRTLGKNFWN